MQATSELRVSPFYHEAKNQIVQPGHFVACSRYFVERWVPRLGGTAVALVLYLRSLGYYNPLTGECRDGVQVSLKQIAAACGCSERTIQRELENNEALQAFVRVEACYQQGAKGHVQRLENAYRIAMDDPIVPEDAPLLQTLIAQREDAVNAAPPHYAVVKERQNIPGTQRSNYRAERNDVRKPQERISPALDVKLTPPSRQIDATLPTDCPYPGVNLTGQDSIQNHIPVEIPKTNNNIPEEVQQREAVVAFLAETGVAINETLTATISREVALNLACLPNIQEIAQRQANYLPFRKMDKGGTWGGLWRKSIEGDWPPPDAYVRHVREEHQRTVRQEAKTQSKQEQKERQGEEAEIAIRVQATWANLSATEQKRIREEAVGCLQPALRKRYEECVRERRPVPKIMQETLDTFCDVLVRQHGSLPERSEQSSSPPRFNVAAEEEPHWFIMPTICGSS